MIEEIRSFLRHEARLLDRGEFAAWLELFAEDAIYWIPRQRGQTDALGVPSIVYDDRALLAIRVQRLLHPRLHAAAPGVHTQHILGATEIVGHDEARNEYRVEFSQLVVEGGEGGQRLMAGECQATLRRRGERFEIAAKRIDLVDCEEVQHMITVPL